MVKLTIYKTTTEADIFEFSTKDEAINFITEYIKECLLDKNYMELDFSIIENSEIPQAAILWRN